MPQAKTKTKKAAIPTPAAEPPGQLRRLFRFSQLAGSDVEGKSTEALELLLQDLRDAGIPQEAIDRIEDLGEKLLKSSADIPRQVNALAGGKDNADLIRSSLAQARTAYKGFKPKDLQKAFDDYLRILKESGESNELIAEIKKIGPDRLAKVGASQTMSALHRRGPDPFITSALNRIRKLAPTPQVGQAVEDALKAVGGGKIPKVAGETAAALKGAGVPGVTGVARAGRAVGRAFGTTGWGFALGTALPALFAGKSLMELPFRKARAQDMAVKGFQALGGTSSAAVLSEIVKQQEMAARRQITLQQFEPDMFRQVLNVLSDTGAAPSTLTDTERRIGTASEVAMPSRRPDKDIKFLLDQLLKESSGPF